MTSRLNMDLSNMDFNYSPELTGYPPPPVLWLTVLIDTLCTPLQCTDHWRDALGVTPDSWLSLRVPSISEAVPVLPSFQDYYSSKNSSGDDNTSSLWQALYTYAFETPSTALADLSTPTAALVLLCLLIVLRAVKSVVMPLFSSLGRHVGRRTHGVEWEAANEERIVKFGEYVFRLIYHSCISLYGVYYFWDKPWWSTGGTLALFQGFPHHPVEPGMTWYYLLQGAYNLDALFSLLVLSFKVKFQSPVQTTKSGKSKFAWPVALHWSPTVRGDFQEMMVHHIITNLLVIGSSHCRFTRIGSMVFLVHDLSDVPVDLSKLANFLKWKWTTLSCFLAMVCVWTATRLYALPFIIYRSILTESHYILDSGMSVLMYINYRHFFYGLVGLLILLHVAWFVMFLQIFATFLKKKELHDLSEHKDGEPPEHTKQQEANEPHQNNNNNNGTPTTTKSDIKSEKTQRPPSSSDPYCEEKKDN